MNEIANRNRHPDREHAPRTVRQRIHHHHSQPRQPSPAKSAAPQTSLPNPVNSRSLPCAPRPPGDLPLCRTEATSTIKSCTQPASTAPISIHRNPGANPNCAASVGPTSRSCSRNRREMMPEQNPLRRRHVVMSIFVVSGAAASRARSSSGPAPRRNKTRCNTGIQSHYTTKRRQQVLGKYFIGYSPRSFLALVFGQLLCGGQVAFPARPNTLLATFYPQLHPASVLRFFPPAIAPWPCSDLWRAACLECAHGWLCHRFCQSRS